MKIITWNCQMAFRKKGHLIKNERPDILIIPECEHPDKLLKLNIKATSVLWHGINQNKGLAVFSFGSYHLNFLDDHNCNIQFACPIAVTGGEVNFTLLAVWTQKTNGHDFRYIGQVWKAVHHYEDILSEKKVIIAGDFNSNVIWDKGHRHASHTMTIKKLSEMNIHSVYHYHFSQIPGSEIHPTFYMQRHENKPYHIDYCFVSEYFMERLGKVKIGNYQDWKMYSDHSPLIVDFTI